MNNKAWLVFGTFFMLEPKGYLWAWVVAFWLCFAHDAYVDWRQAHPESSLGRLAKDIRKLGR